MSKSLIDRYDKKVALFHSMQQAFSCSIKNMRIVRGETLAEFSRYTGISSAQLSRYENRISPVPITVAIRLGFLEFTPGENFTLEPVSCSAKKTVNQEDQMTAFEVVR